MAQAANIACIVAVYTFSDVVRSPNSCSVFSVDWCTPHEMTLQISSSSRTTHFSDERCQRRGFTAYISLFRADIRPQFWSMARRFLFLNFKMSSFD